MLQVFSKCLVKSIILSIIILSNDALSETHKNIDRRKRSLEENSDGNNTSQMNLTQEVCVGAEEYCNMTREGYMEMMNNYIFPQAYEWVLIATHTLVFVVGLVGNALVCVAVYRNHTMRTVTNYFIVNLAAADFLVILMCLPPTVLWDVTETWFFGAAMCKTVLYFQSVSVTVSVLTLTFISVDRWYAICFPLRFKSTTGRAKVAIFLIWTISLTFTIINSWIVYNSINGDINKIPKRLFVEQLMEAFTKKDLDVDTDTPELIVLTTEQLVPLRFELQYLVQCVATWSGTSDLIWHIIKLVFIYTVPLTLMTVAYYQIVKVLWRSERIPGQADTAKLELAQRTKLRSRRKAAKMLAAVVIMFAVCYFPVNLLSVLRYTLDMEQNDVITFLALISHVMCYANSAINPLIYNFMNGKFRREFRRAFCCSVESVQENSTTMSRLTSTKKNPRELMPFENRRPTHGYVCQSAMF